MESGVGIIGTQLSCMKLSHNIKLKRKIGSLKETGLNTSTNNCKMMIIIGNIV